MSDNPFAFLCRLPDAELSGDVDRAPGIVISGAWCGQNAVVNCLHGSLAQERTYTIGIAGRGTLQIPEKEFRELLSGMIALFEYMADGYHRVKATSPSIAGEPLIPDTKLPDTSAPGGGA